MNSPNEKQSVVRRIDPEIRKTNPPKTPTETPHN